MGDPKPELALTLRVQAMTAPLLIHSLHLRLMSSLIVRTFGGGSNAPTALPMRETGGGYGPVVYPLDGAGDIPPLDGSGETFPAPGEAPKPPRSPEPEPKYEDALCEPGEPPFEGESLGEGRGSMRGERACIDMI